MGYFANGGGQVVPMKDKKVPDDVLALLSSAEFLVEDAPDGGVWLTFEFRNYNDQIDGAMNALAPYVKSGNIEFTGEDGEHWRFHFDNGTVVEESAKVVYPSDTKRKRKIMVDYCSSDGEGTVEIDVDGGSFMETVNDLLVKFYEWADEEDIENTQIVNIVEEE